MRTRDEWGALTRSNDILPEVCSGREIQVAGTFEGRCVNECLNKWRQRLRGKYSDDANIDSQERYFAVFPWWGDIFSPAGH